MALYELRKYDEGARVWVGKYESLRNLPHWHNDCELIYVEKGTGSVHVGNSAFALEAGASVYVDSGEIHSIEADEGSLIIIFLFDYREIFSYFRRKQTHGFHILANTCAIYQNMDVGRVKDIRV